MNREPGQFTARYTPGQTVKCSATLDAADSPRVQQIKQRAKSALILAFGLIFLAGCLATISGTHSSLFRGPDLDKSWGVRLCLILREGVAPLMAVFALASFRETYASLFQRNKSSSLPRIFGSVGVIAAIYLALYLWNLPVTGNRFDTALQWQLALCWLLLGWYFVFRDGQTTATEPATSNRAGSSI